MQRALVISPAALISMTSAIVARVSRESDVSAATTKYQAQPRGSLSVVGHSGQLLYVPKSADALINSDKATSVSFEI